MLDKLHKLDIHRLNRMISEKYSESNQRLMTNVFDLKGEVVYVQNFDLKSNNLDFNHFDKQQIGKVVHLVGGKMLTNIDLDLQGGRSKQKVLKSKASIIVSDPAQMVWACEKFILFRD